MPKPKFIWFDTGKTISYRRASYTGEPESLQIYMQRFTTYKVISALHIYKQISFDGQWGSIHCLFKYLLVAIWEKDLH